MSAQTTTQNRTHTGRTQDARRRTHITHTGRTQVARRTHTHAERTQARTHEAGCSHTHTGRTQARQHASTPARQHASTPARKHATTQARKHAHTKQGARTRTLDTHTPQPPFAPDDMLVAVWILFVVCSSGPHTYPNFVPLIWLCFR